MGEVLTGRPIAITGAGTGIGRATAIACARAGMPVALAGRRIEPLEEVRESIESAGGRAIAAPTDVADAEQCRDLIRRTVDAFGPIYSVFANAGYGLRGPVDALEDSAIRAIFETNFWGTLNTIRPALEVMLPEGQGHVLICSSCLSKIGTPYTAPYSATKAAQDHFGRAMRHELSGRGIRVSTVHPIGTRTEFFDASARRSGGSRGAKKPPAMFTQSPDGSPRPLCAACADRGARCGRASRSGSPSPPRPRARVSRIGFSRERFANPRKRSTRGGHDANRGRIPGPDRGNLNLSCQDQQRRRRDARTRARLPTLSVAGAGIPTSESIANSIRCPVAVSNR